jgi:hypothetical protein
VVLQLLRNAYHQLTLRRLSQTLHGKEAMTHVVTLSTLTDAAVVNFYAKQGQKCCPTISTLAGKVHSHPGPKLLSPARALSPARSFHTPPYECGLAASFAFFPDGVLRRSRQTVFGSSTKPNALRRWVPQRPFRGPVKRGLCRGVGRCAIATRLGAFASWLDSIVP